MNCKTIGQASLSLSKIKKVFFEGENVKSFSLQSFSGITEMMMLDIPNGVTQIGSYCFYLNLTPVIKFPSTLKTLEMRCFWESGIKSANFRNCVELTNIPYQAFKSCASLETLELPPNIESLSEEAFSQCVLLQNVTLPPKTSLLGTGSFQNCRKLENINIESTVPLSILSNAFSDCNLTTIYFGNGTSIIYQNAFSNNPFLAEITFSENCILSEIQTDSFTGCNSVRIIRLGKNVSQIYPGAFSQMYALNDILVSEKCPFYQSIDGVLFSFDKETLAAFPSGRSECAVADGTKYIGKKAFYKCKKLRNLTFGNNPVLESISGFTFAGCSGLSTIKLPESLNQIAENGFEGCDSLDSISFDGASKLKVLKKNTFAGCNSISSVSFEETAELISIESGVFKGFLKLKIFRSPPSLIKIESDAFADCSNLEVINLSNVEEFGERCFQGCQSLLFISFSPKLRKLSKDSFRDCDSLDYLSYCGEGEFTEKAFDSFKTLIKVKMSYKYSTFGNIKVWYIFDEDCRVGTQQFTPLPVHSFSVFCVGLSSLSEVNAGEVIVK